MLCEGGWWEGVQAALVPPALCWKLAEEGNGAHKAKEPGAGITSWAQSWELHLSIEAVGRGNESDPKEVSEGSAPAPHGVQLCH